MNEIFNNLYEMTAFSNIIAEPQFLIMYAIAFILLYLGIKKEYEPLLLIPIAFGVLLANFPGGDMGVIQADENGMINVHGVMKNIWEMPLHDIAQDRFPTADHLHGRGCLNRFWSNATQPEALHLWCRRTVGYLHSATCRDPDGIHA